MYSAKPKTIIPLIYFIILGISHATAVFPDDFRQSEIRVTSVSGSRVTIDAGTKDDVASRGTGAGPANNWIQSGDLDVIAHTRLLDPGETVEIKFAAPPPGIYQFVCTFPGHNLSMFGEFLVTP